MTARNRFCACVAVALLLSGCASSDDDDAAANESRTSSSTDGGAPSGPAPGVTDDTVKIGVAYVDTASLAAVNLNYELGDFEAAYQALVDDINADGGINGRTLEVAFAPIDPTSPQPAEEACVELTEDDDVFLVTGFFLTDAVKCPVATHATAVVGGTMNPERLELAEAPWLTWAPDTDQPEQVTRTLAEKGELDGTVAVFGTALDQATMDAHVLPVLGELGIEPVETAVLDAPRNDTAAVQSQTRLIAERFEAAGADTVLIVGPGGAAWPPAMTGNPYRPKLLFTDIMASRSFATNEATIDTSVLEGSLSGGGFGPDQARYEEPQMQECIDVLREAGVDVPEPAASGDDPSNQPYQAAFLACPDIDVTRAWLEAAGEDLHYGTLAAAINGLEVQVSGEPTPLEFGPPPDADGNPRAYLFSWNEEARDFEIESDS
jgi:Periplasmic binding protein